MFWNQQQRNEEQMSEVNMTPLIDVSLVLVVILLLATPLAFESSFGVQKSAASARQAPEETQPARIELSILSDDSVQVNRMVVPRWNLGETLKPLLEESQTGQVMVSCHDEVSHGTFVDVLDITKLSGAKEIAVAGR